MDNVLAGRLLLHDPQTPTALLTLRRRPLAWWVELTGTLAGHPNFPDDDPLLADPLPMRALRAALARPDITPTRRHTLLNRAHPSTLREYLASTPDAPSSDLDALLNRSATPQRPVPTKVARAVLAHPSATTTQLWEALTVLLASPHIPERHRARILVASTALPPDAQAALARRTSDPHVREKLRRYAHALHPRDALIDDVLRRTRRFDNPEDWASAVQHYPLPQIAQAAADLNTRQPDCHGRAPLVSLWNHPRLPTPTMVTSILNADPFPPSVWSPHRELSPERYAHVSTHDLVELARKTQLHPNLSHRPDVDADTLHDMFVAVTTNPQRWAPFSMRYLSQLALHPNADDALHTAITEDITTYSQHRQHDTGYQPQHTLTALELIRRHGYQDAANHLPLPGAGGAHPGACVELNHLWTAALRTHYDLLARPEAADLFYDLSRGFSGTLGDLMLTIRTVLT